MKKILEILLLLFIVTSCSNNEYEKNLIGTWNNFPSSNGSNEIRFYPDSIILYENIYRRKGTWKADESKIYFKFPLKIPDSLRNFNYNYSLSDNMDSLILISHIDSIKFPTFFKIEDTWKHYMRQIDLQIDLPQADFDLVRNDSMYFGINIYVGYKNNTLSIMGDRGNQLDSSEIKYYVYSIRDSKKESEIDKMNFNLIVDKSVDDNKVDSIKLILNRFPEMKIFRVYKNDTANYGKYDFENYTSYGWNWYGRFE